MDAMTVLVIAEGVAILLLGLLVAGLLRSHAEILRRLHALGVSMEGEDGAPELDFAATIQSPGAAGATGHDVTGTTPEGDAIAVRVAGARHRTLIAFLSSGCLTCADFWDSFRSDARHDLGDTRLVIVTKDASEESPARIRGLAPTDSPVIMTGQAWIDYQVPGSPYFALVDGPSRRIIGEGSAGSWEQLRTLMGEALADRKGARARRKARADVLREARADHELMSAGIYPGDPSLYENPEQEDPP